MLGQDALGPVVSSRPSCKEVVSQFPGTRWAGCCSVGRARATLLPLDWRTLGCAFGSTPQRPACSLHPRETQCKILCVPRGGRLCWKCGRAVVSREPAPGGGIEVSAGTAHPTRADSGAGGWKACISDCVGWHC